MDINAGAIKYGYIDYLSLPSFLRATQSADAPGSSRAPPLGRCVVGLLMQEERMRDSSRGAENFGRFIATHKSISTIAATRRHTGNGNVIFLLCFFFPALSLRARVTSRHCCART